MNPAFADPAAESRPLQILSPDALPGWLAAQTAPLRDWVTQAGFQAKAGEVLLLPGPGGLAGAVLGQGKPADRAQTRFSLARAATVLPAGDWHLEGDLTRAEQDEVALGWLLAAYRFDRYRKPKDTPVARLKCPEGSDLRRLLAMAVGE